MLHYYHTLQQRPLNKVRTWIIVLISLLSISLFHSCRVSKYVPEEDALVIKRSIITDSKSVKKGELSPYCQVTKNKKFLFYFNSNLWAYSKTKKGKKRPRWIRNISGTPPSILKTGSIDESKKKIKAYLGNMGYFDAVVTDSIVRYGRTNQKAKVWIKVKTNDPYTISSYHKKIQNSEIDSILEAKKFKSKIKIGDNFNYVKLEKERDNITSLLRNNGFYFFSSDFIFYDADSTKAPKTIDLILNLKQNPLLQGEDDDTARINSLYGKRFVVKNIYINPQYDPLQTDFSTTDTIIAYKLIGKKPFDTVYYNFIRYKKKLTKNKAYTHSLYVYPDTYYSDYDRIKSRKQLLSLPITSYVKLNFTPTNLEGKTGTLDCLVEVSRAKLHKVRIDTEGTNSEGALGIAGKVTYQNRNIFRGAERLSVTVKVSAEMQNSLTEPTNSNYGIFNTFETALELSLSLPRFWGPIRQGRFRKYFRPSTSITGGVNHQTRPDYNRLLTLLNLEWKWNLDQKNLYKFKPIDFNIVNINKSQEFEDYLLSLQNSRLYEQYSNHFIMDMAFTYIYNSQNLLLRKDFNFFKGSIETAGNLLYGISSLFNTSKTDNGYYTIFDIRYSQYFKIDGDYRHYFMLGSKSTLVFRSMIGIGIPYGNAEALPFEKGYYSGGANGMRAWELYRLGPGATPKPSVDGFERIGDIKMEFNLEWRFPVYSYLKGAIFTDAGNIWLLKKDPDFPDGEFNMDTFYKQIAWDAGLGFRLDFDFFLIRIDPALALFNPGNEVGQRWISHKVQLKDIYLNFGIGFPF